MTLDFGNFDLTNSNTGGSDNNKLNIDLSNISSAGKKVIDGQWVKVQTRLMSNVDLTNETGATVKNEISVSSILPEDDYNYELIVSWWLNANPPSTVGAINNIRGGFTYYDTNGQTSYTYSMAAENYKISSNATLSIPSLGTTSLVVTSARKIILNIYNNGYGTMSDLTTVAYRRIGTNN